MLLEKPLTNAIVGAAIEVHRALGPGLVESAYEACFCKERDLPGLKFARQVELPLEYKGTRVDCGYRPDLLVEERGVVEIKTVERIAPVHEAQLLTYLRLTGCRMGLIVNFLVPVMKDGISRRVLERHRL